MRYFSKGLLTSVLGLALAPALSFAVASETEPSANDIKSGPLGPQSSAMDKPGDNTGVVPADVPRPLEAANSLTDQNGTASAGTKFDGRSGESVPPPKTKVRRK